MQSHTPEIPRDSLNKNQEGDGNDDDAEDVHQESEGIGVVDDDLEVVSRGAGESGKEGKGGDAYDGEYNGRNGEVQVAKHGGYYARGGEGDFGGRWVGGCDTTLERM